MTSRYTHPSESQKRKVVERIGHLGITVGDKKSISGRFEMIENVNLFGEVLYPADNEGWGVALSYQQLGKEE